MTPSTPQQHTQLLRELAISADHYAAQLQGQAYSRNWAQQTRNLAARARKAADEIEGRSYPLGWHIRPQAEAQTAMHHLIEDSGLSPDSPERKRRLVPTPDGGRHWYQPYTNEGNGTTMLAALKDGCVFQVARSMHGIGFRIEEASESYEHLFLTPAQLYQLGTELHEMAKTLIDQPPATPCVAPSCAPPQPPQDPPA